LIIQMTNNKIWVASIDIGSKNFAFYIEEIDTDNLSSISNISKELRYNIDGTPTPAFKNILKSLFLNGKLILFKNSDLTSGCKKGVYLDPETFHNMTDLLDKHRDYWGKCESFVIEQQMSFGKKHNTLALKLGQHCFSYFAITYGRFKNVIEFPSYHKTQVIGAPKIQNKTKTGKVTYKALDKPARKKWSVVMAKEILEERDDQDTLKFLSSSKKKDDLADVIVMLQSWKYITYVDKLV